MFSSYQRLTLITVSWLPHPICHDGPLCCAGFVASSNNLAHVISDNIPIEMFVDLFLTSILILLVYVRLEVDEATRVS